MKLNYKRTIFIGFAFLSICSFWQMYDNIIPLILQNTFGLKETVVGFVMSIDNILAVFLLPLIGGISDRVDTRLGKRTPFIIVGTIVSVVFMLLLPFADSAEIFWLFVLALGVTLFSMAMYRTPAVALMPDLTPRPLRSKGNAIINLMGALGAIYTLILIKTIVDPGDRPNYFPLFIGIAGIMIIAVIILIFTIHEKSLAKTIAEEYPEEAKEDAKIEEEGLSPDVKKSLMFILISISLWFMAYNAVTTAFSRYATKVWGLGGGAYAGCLMVATVAAVLSYIPIGFISEKLGRKKTIMGGVVIMIICYLSASFFSNFNFVINVFFAFIGFSWAAINVNSLPMVVEMSKGSDIGKYTGLYYTFSMSAQIVTPILSGFLLQHVSYKTLFPYAVFFMLLAFISMIQVKHGDSKPTKKKSVIEHFDVDD
ncbi:MAG: MFS transporter [Treponema sp. CETP13]|nr:MAG: MFS transporter [Treponema sp. CETP13]